MQKEFSFKDGHLICPECGSTNVQIHCSMFVDRVICLDCHFESLG